VSAIQTQSPDHSWRFDSGPRAFGAAVVFPRLILNMTSCVLLPTGPGTHSKVRRSWEHSTQGLLDWFEVDLAFTELLFIQIDLLYIFIIKKR